MYYYRGFGLIFHSEIKIPELFVVKNKEEIADKRAIKIVIGQIPEKLSSKDVEEIVSSWVSPTAYLLKLKGIANYFVENGALIIIEPNKNKPDDWISLRLFLLETVIIALIHQRGLLPLNASGIHYKDGVVLFCGRLGYGKSSIVAALSLLGYKPFSDGVCILKTKESPKGKALVFADYPLIKLWDETIRMLNNPKFLPKKPIRQGVHRYNYSFLNDFTYSGLPIYKIFILDFHMEKELLFVRERYKSQIQKIKELDLHICQKNHLKILDLERKSFQLLANVVPEIPMIRIARKAYHSSIHQYINFIINEL